jgi:hypothetical protein
MQRHDDIVRMAVLLFMLPCPKASSSDFGNKKAAAMCMIGRHVKQSRKVKAASCMSLQMDRVWVFSVYTETTTEVMTIARAAPIATYKIL